VVFTSGIIDERPRPVLFGRLSTAQQLVSLFGGGGWVWNLASGWGGVVLAHCWVLRDQPRARRPSCRGWVTDSHACWDRVRAVARVPALSGLDLVNWIVDASISRRASRRSVTRSQGLSRFKRPRMFHVGVCLVFVVSFVVVVFVECL
jgi:hypothetical protein